MENGYVALVACHDDYGLGEVISGLLSNKGYRTLLVDTREDFYSIIENNEINPRIVIMDANLGNYGGEDVEPLRRANNIFSSKIESKEIELIGISGSLSVVDLALSENLFCLAKPTGICQWISKLKNYKDSQTKN